MDPEPKAHGNGPGVESPGTGPATEPAPDVTEAPPERPHGDPLREDVTSPGSEPAAPQREHEPTPDPNAPQPAGEPEAPTGPAPAAQAPPEAAEGPQPHAAKVTQDLEELTAKADKADEYLELAQRTKADFENYRRRAAREAALAQERGIAKLAKELLPAVDNLDRALEAVEAQTLAQGDPRGAGDTNGDSQLLSGIKLVHADVVAALQRAGIERFEPKGEQFDPQHHEAVAQHPVEGAASGTIVEVYQRGYRIGDSVLRPARVVVAQ